MASLKTHVAVAGPDNTTVWFGPGDELPEWAVSAITNPDVWDQQPLILKGSDGAGVKRGRRSAPRPDADD